MEKIDLSAEFCGIKFKNPVLSGSSELACNPESVRRLIKSGVGGIVTKTYTTMKLLTKRPRPYQFPYRKFGKGYLQSGSFFTMAFPHPEDIIDKTIKKDIPEMVRLCDDAKIPLIVSYFGEIEDVDDWVKLAKMFEERGVSMLEVNLSCPQAKAAFEKRPELSVEILKAVSGAVSIPVGPKVGPDMVPIDEIARKWTAAGARFIAAHNAPEGILIDLETEEPYGAPVIGGYILGRTFLPQSLSRIVQIKKSVDIPIIGIGGIYCGDDALQYILCGCSHVLVCTSAYFEGTEIIKKILQGIQDWMKKKGYSSIREFEGKALGSIIPINELRIYDDAGFSIPPDTPYVPVIDEDMCTMCLKCLKFCNYEVFSHNRTTEKILIDDKKCWSCGLCVGLCGSGSIRLVDRETRKKKIWDGTGMAEPFKRILNEYKKRRTPL